LGHKRFLLFYLASGIAAGLGQWIIDPSSAGSVIGASGAIAGVLGGYLAIWWWQDILVLHPTSMFIPGTVKSCFVLIYWFVVQQLFPVYQQYMHFSASQDHTAYGEHIGGFVLGFLVALVIRLKEPTSETCYNPSDCSPCDTKFDVDHDGE
jgi:membrane associated rhomboid family serine protease